MIRVAIADDHPFIRRGLRETLEEAAGIEVVAEYADGAVALDGVRSDPVDVLVTDLTMPGVGGLELASRLKAEGSGVAVLVLSIHPEGEVAFQALQAGAMGYVEKAEAPERVVEAVRTVAAGRLHVGAEQAEMLARSALGHASPEPELSPRELQVVRGIAAGTPRAEIAAALAVSPVTVSTYRGRALRKLGISSDADLARYAVKNGLVE